MSMLSNRLMLNCKMNKANTFAVHFYLHDAGQAADAFLLLSIPQEGCTITKTYLYNLTPLNPTFI